MPDPSSAVARALGRTIDDPLAKLPLCPNVSCSSIALSHAMTPFISPIVCDLLLEPKCSLAATTMLKCTHCELYRSMGKYEQMPSVTNPQANPPCHACARPMEANYAISFKIGGYTPSGAKGTYYTGLATVPGMWRGPASHHSAAEGGQGAPRAGNVYLGLLCSLRRPAATRVR